jgi:hypothetical protein
VWQDEEDKLGWPFGIRTRATSRWCRAHREGSGAWHVWTLSSPGRPRSRASERLRADLPGKYRRRSLGSPRQGSLECSTIDLALIMDGYDTG